MNNHEFRMSSFLKSFVQKNRALTISLVVFIFLAALSGLLPPYMMRYLLDDVIPDYMSGQAGGNGMLILFSFLYFLSYFLVGGFTVMENFLLSFFGQRMIHEMRYEMIKKADKLKANFYTHHGKGEMLSRVMDDVYAVETLFASGIVSILVSLIKIIGILVSIFLFSWLLGLIILCLIPVIYVITRLISKKMLKANINNRKAINAQANSISESLENMRTIQNLDKEKYREDGYVSLLESSYRMRDRSAILDAVFSPIVELLKALLIALVSFLVFYLSSSDVVMGFTAGTFAASLSFISNIFSPIQNIGQEMQTMQEGISGLKRVVAFMNEKEINQKDETLTYETIFKEEKDNIIEVDNLSFRYDDGDIDIFHGMNFVIHKGEKVTIIGRTGAGKTTFFKMLLGLENPTAGKVLVNGYDASMIPDREKRRILGYVEQGFQSINGTIMDQIILYDEKYSLDEVRKVMQKVNLDDYVMNDIKGGYQAMFKETEFSRGQLQLLSLARALLSNPKILLLDEISANLDSKTEKDVISALSDIGDDKTILSISHRLSDQLGFDKTIEITNQDLPEER